MGYYDEKRKYEMSKWPQYSPATDPNLSLQERERQMVFQEEFGKLNKAGAYTLLVIGAFTLVLLIGIPFYIVGMKKLQVLRNEAWEKAVKRIPYTHEKRSSK